MGVPKSIESKQSAKNEIDRAINLVFDEFACSPLDAVSFRRLLDVVRARTSLLCSGSGGKRVSAKTALFVIRRLKNFAWHDGAQIRPWHDWKPRGEGARALMRELAAYLFAEFSTPPFMDLVWDLETGDAWRQQEWFIQLASGKSVRELDLPIPLTQRMQHLFREAPDHFTVLQALRYAETRALGGDERLACMIAKTDLGQAEMPEPEFWRSVIRFFVAHPDFKWQAMEAIIDFCYVQKFAREEILTADGIQTGAASWPEFRIEGRTRKSMVEMVRPWDREARYCESHRRSWKASGIRPYRLMDRRPDEADREWNMVELLNSAALNAEGRAMKHCVMIYDYDCRELGTSIWSLRLKINNEEKRIATIEVTKERKITQVKTRENKTPRPYALSLIHKWARGAGLDFPRSA